MGGNKNSKSCVDEKFELVNNSKTFLRILKIFQLKEKKVLDIGCSYGEHLVHFGNESIGITTTREEVEYGKNKKLKIIQGNAEQIDALNLGSFQVIWANCLFEHILSPHSFLIKLKIVSQHDTLLILGVPVIPRIVSLLRLNKFRGALAVSHINFFTKESLKLTVERAGWQVVDIRSFFFSNHILDLFLSCLAPHLYVIASNDEGFKYTAKKMKEWKDEPYYSQIIKITKSL